MEYIYSRTSHIFIISNFKSLAIGLTVALLLMVSVSSWAQSTSPAPYAGGPTTNGTLNLIELYSILFNETTGPTTTYSNQYIYWNNLPAATIVRGQMHHMSVQDGRGSGYTRTIGMWIDYNSDNDFNDAGEKLGEVTFYGSGSYSVASQYFNVPTGATLGATRVRTRVVYNTTGLSPTATYAYGQTWDYDVDIIDEISPVAPPVVFDGGNIVEADAGLVHITNVTLGSINNNSAYFGTSTTGYNYSNYTGQYVTDLTAGQNYTLSVTKTNYTSTVAAWIDWNNDGDFLDTGEEIGNAYVTPANTVTFNFTAPSGIPDATQSMMRIRNVYDNVTGVITPSNTTFGIANSNNNNETEDYRVNFINAGGCSITAGTASPTYQWVTTNGTAALTLTGSTGSTIQWQDSTTGGSWTNVTGGTGATSANYTSASLSNGSYFYRAVVTDGGSCTVYSNEVTVAVALNPVYCSGAGSSGPVLNNHIEDLGFHEWTDPNPGYVTGSYYDYSNTGTYGQATVVAGQYHHFGATLRSNGTGTASTTIAIWIDFNSDGVFDNTDFSSGGELIDIQNFSSTVANTYAAYLTIPATALGDVRMRVRVLRGNFSSIDPCGVYSNSQTKDLTVHVLPQISGGQVCGTVHGSADVVATNSTVDLVNITRVHVTGPSGTVIDHNSDYFGFTVGLSNILYNYSNFMGSFSNGLEFDAGAPYSVSIEHSGYTNVAGLFIDWNGDGDFQDANELVGRLSDPNANPFVFNFTAPANLVDGTEVAMRVRMRYDDVASLGNTLHACNNILDGLGEYSEVEDYRATLNVEPLVCAAVTNVAAAIGDPANGTAHHMTVTWDHLTGALSYDIDYSTNGSSWTNLATSHLGNSYDHNTGDSPNVSYYYRVRAKDGSQTCPYGTMGTPVYTACDVPAVPTTSNVTGSTMDVSIATETPVANPAITTYSIYESTTGQYVQANGSLGATEVFQTKATWGAVTVTGLNATTEYCYLAKAKNFDGDERGGSGATILTTQEFNSDVLVHGATGPLTSWFAPNSNTPLAYTASGGCTGGHASFTSSWNSFWGNFIRTPEQNCTGQDEVTLSFDLSNSYFAAQPNDGVYFNMYADGGYIDATSIKIGGTEVGTASGGNYWLYFDQARSCVTVDVTYDLTGVTNKTNILFYLNASCGYNNSNVFSVSMDNITLREAADVACATTTVASTPDLVVQSITPNTSNICNGSSVTYDVVVENAGGQAIANGTSFDVSAYTGSLVCGGTAVATQSFSSGLGIGATTTLNFNLTLSGSSDVSFEVDANNDIAEGNESNNCSGNNGVTIASGLGGTYTIDASSATGGTNYNSFSDAASDLNTYGVCAAVIFEVATDVYNENITLTDVAGVSAVNTVTFRSATGVAAQVTLQSSTTDVVALHNADYFRFEDMTIDYNGTSNYSAIELQDDADNTIITDCILDGSTSTSTTNANAIIYVYETSSSYEVDGLEIYNTEFNDGGNGIYFASSSSESTGIIVDGCTFNDQYRRGMYLDDCAAPQVTSNTIICSVTANSSYAAIDLDNGSGAADISKNIIYGDYIKSGIVIDNSDATSGNEAVIANNFIAIAGSVNAPRGIDITGSDYVNVYFNSVSMTNSNNSLGYAALYMGSSTIADGTVNIVNNIFSVTNGGSSQTGIYLASTNNRNDIGTIDYNNYYATGSASIAYSSGDYTLTTWQTLLSDDANSIEVDPQFTSTTDLHVANNALSAADNSTGISEDIDGDTRQPIPTIGADEFAVATTANDAGVTDMTQPVSACPGSNTFEVEVTNFGTNALTSFTVSWSVNGSAQTPVNVTGVNIAQGNSTTVSLGSFSLVSNTAYTFVFATSNPNGTTDDNSANDTRTETPVYTALSGTYTVGGTTPDFTDFNDAADALHAYGVCGAVVFNVREGTYTEQVEFNAIAGASVTNDITFQADPANSNPAVLQYNSQSFSDNYVLGIYGTSYLRFDGLTINTTNTSTYRTVIDFLQGNLDIEFTNNIIEAPQATSNSLNYALINSSNSAADKDDEILFDGNTITNGSYGINLEATSSAWETDLVITNNTITGFNAYGINVEYRTNVTIDNNIIRNGYATANATGIDLFYADGDLSIQGNIIECSGTSNTKTGINTGPFEGTQANRAVIANNFVSVEGTSTCQGIFLGSTTDYVDVIFNNVYTNGTNASSTRAFYMNGADSIRVYNNNFIAGGAGYAMYILSPTNGLQECDYNNLSTGNTEFVYRSGNKADLATWQAEGFDANSVSIDPQYTSTTSPMDLHVAASGIAGAGVSFGGITVDIDGDARATPPTIGADEANATGCGQTHTWTGTIDTDWHKDGNWGCGEVPDKTKDVIIPAAPVNQPVIFDTFTGECKTICILDGASLTIQKIGTLNVNKP